MTSTALGVALVFVIGYVFIVAENLTRIAKPATALIMALVGWMLCAMNAREGGVVDLSIGKETAINAALGATTASICSTLLYLFEAMVIVAAVDAAGGFDALARWIDVHSPRWLMLTITATTFALSMILDNVTTTIVMLAIMRRLVERKSVRRWFAVMVVVAANAGGAASPIGDVTSLLLWTSGRLDAVQFFVDVLPAALFSMSVPLAVMCARVGNLKERPTDGTRLGKFLADASEHDTQRRAVDASAEASEPSPTRASTQSVVVVFLALAVFAAVPLFVVLTDLPPFVAIMPAVAVVWQFSGARIDDILRRVNVSTLVFLFGILLTVGALKESGALDAVGALLPDGEGGAAVVGVLSAFIDNVPLVSAVVASFTRDVTPDFWPMLAYAASVGGSLFVTGSAAGLVAMDTEGVTFGWFVRAASIPILAGIVLGWTLL